MQTCHMFASCMLLFIWIYKAVYNTQNWHKGMIEMIKCSWCYNLNLWIWRQTSWSILVQVLVMACHLCSHKPLLKPMMTLGTLGTNYWNFNQNTNIFYFHIQENVEHLYNWFVVWEPAKHFEILICNQNVKVCWFVIYGTHNLKHT